MIYVMSQSTYWGYIREGLTHDQLIEYLNRKLNLRGPIVELHIKKEV